MGYVRNLFPSAGIYNNDSNTIIQFKNNAPLLGLDPFKAPFPISVLRAHADMGRNAVKLISKLEQSTHGFAT
jgi:hypothetical protein